MLVAAGYSCDSARFESPTFECPNSSCLMLSPYSRAIFVILEASRSRDKWDVHRDEPHWILLVSVRFLESGYSRLRAAWSCVKTNTFQQGVILTTVTYEMHFWIFMHHYGTPGTFSKGDVLRWFRNPSHTFGAWDDSVSPLTRIWRVQSAMLVRRHRVTKNVLGHLLDILWH